MAPLEAVIHAAKKLYIETWMLRTLGMPPGAYSCFPYLQRLVKSPIEALSVAT